MDLFLFYIPFKGKERPVNSKMMPTKLCAVLAYAESLILRLSPRKRIFSQNHFSRFLRGRGGLVSSKKMPNNLVSHEIFGHFFASKRNSGTPYSWHCHFKQNIIFKLSSTGIRMKLDKIIALLPCLLIFTFSYALLNTVRPLFIFECAFLLQLNSICFFKL